LFVISGHLQIAYSYVSDAWFPVHPELLQLIRAKLTSGEIATPDALLSELKRDFSLYTYCVGKLARLIKDQSGENATSQDPLELLCSAEGPATLNTLLSGATTPPSRHLMAQTNQNQARQMQHAITAASVAESLATSAELDSNLTYTCALMRHLGLTLVMWNYPHVYSRTSGTPNKGQTFEETLTKKLGFSPAMLGIVMARQWGLSPTARLVLGDKNVRFSDEASASKAHTIADGVRKLCEIGELFADLSGETDALKVTADLEKLRAELQQRLGDAGMQLLANKIEERSELYLRALPQMFRPPTPIIKARSDSRLAARYLHNRYVQQCPPEFREQVNGLYALLEDKSSRKKAVDELIKRIIPSAGFGRGCVYLVDPETMLLRPRLAIGKAALAEFLPVPVRGSEKSPATAAYHAMTPILGVLNAGGPAPRPCYIAASLGNHQRMGVLYLEHPEPSGAVSCRTIPLTYFKAIRQAFTDCLNIY
jgi:hypothetical protein